MNPSRPATTRGGRLPFRLAAAALGLLLGAPLGAAPEPPVPVSVRPAAELLFQREYSAPAEVVALNDVRLSAEISARVLEIPARVGDRVSQGDLLAALDCRDYQSRADAQQATRLALETRLKLARTQLQRARDLKRERNISDEEVDRRQTELLALNAELAAQAEAQVQARLNVERCQIKAPFTAVVTGRLASVGALAAPGTPLVQLVQLDGAEVSARIRPEEAEAGAAAETVAFSWQGGRFPLQVLRTLPVVDPSTRTIEVRFGFSGASAPPGASGRVVWRSAAAFLPADLLVRRADGLGVFLFNDHQAHFHPLPGALEGQPARAVLPEGARIVVDGRHGLKDGQRVDINPVAPAPR